MSNRGVSNEVEFLPNVFLAITKGKSEAEKAITNSTGGPQILVSFVFFLFADPFG